MPSTVDGFPLTQAIAPTEQAGVAEAIRTAFAAGTPVYPLGGGTSLGYGLPARQPGIGLSLAGLTRVVDYPARDMTVTVEAGIRLGDLARLLASERQWLPIDAPQPDEATLGGLVATAWSGAHRYGWGTMRDYVIGISAVDGRGTPFKGGGRVVKNVAGYDFCKLLTGSLGTLAAITQVTLKLKPLPDRSVLACASIRDLDEAERLLSGLVQTATTPTAIELLVGPEWRDEPSLPPLAAGSMGRLLVGLEGTAAEVEWMADTVSSEWRRQGVGDVTLIAESGGGESPSGAAAVWTRLRDFSAGEAELVLKAVLPPSRVCSFVSRLLATDTEASVQAHAGSGVVIARFPQFAPADVSRRLLGELQPAAATCGHLTVVASTMTDLTRQCVWGAVGAPLPWMNAVKQQFDPRGILNPGRFVF